VLPHTAFTPETPGLYMGIPMDVYQAAPGFSKSHADVLRRSPLDLHRMQTGQLARPVTDAMEMGTTYHSLVWEGREDFYERPDSYINEKGDEKKWNGNATACRDWMERHSDKPVYSLDEAEEIRNGARYIQSHRLAADILSKPGMAEVSMFARESERGKIIKGRADWVWFDQGRIFFADLKKTKDASTRAVSREILNRRYHVQAAWYRSIAQTLGYTFGGFVFCFFEAGKAPKCNVRNIAAQAIDFGEVQMKADLGLWHQCRMANHWPEWSDHEENIGTVDLPDFVYGDETLDFAA
jgi:hypothetical protein